MEACLVAPARAMRPASRYFTHVLAQSSFSSARQLRVQQDGFLSLSKRRMTATICSKSQQRRTYTSDAKNASSPKLSTEPPRPSYSSMSSSSTPGKDDLGTSAELPSQTEHRRTRASKHFTHVMDNLQSKIFIANQRLNDLTGYSGIESLKASIETQEALASETRATVREAKDAYTTAIAQRSASQREVNELLQRKHNWTAADLERFTELYRSDHANEQAEQAAADALAAAETQAEEIGSRLSKSILARYHEEQIWSDKIRRMSTWGTWGLMGVNILLFIIFQVAVEPWRRKRLVSGFEEKVKQAFELEKMTALAGTTGVVTTAEVEEVPLVEKSPEVIDDDPSLLSQDTAGVESTDSPQSSPPAPSTTIERLRASAADLVSERAVTLRRVDLTTLVMEGMAVGAASVALAFWLIGLRRG